MKYGTLILLILLLTGCGKQAEEISLDDIDEQVIREFYDNVLDTLIGDDLLYTVPDTNPHLLNNQSAITGLTGPELRFIRQQIEKFSALRWEDLVTGAKIMTEEEHDVYFGETLNWQLFYQTYGYRHISYITVPLFTPDGKRVFVEQGRLCGRLCGEGCIIEWEMNEGEWVFRKLNAVWIAK